MANLHEPKLISGNANRPLAEAVAARMSMHRGMDVNLVDARVERFNDGEIFVEVFENVRGEDMYIIQPTSNPTNDNLMELLIIADALRRSSAARITASLQPSPDSRLRALTVSSRGIHLIARMAACGGGCERGSGARAGGAARAARRGGAAPRARSCVRARRRAAPPRESLIFSSRELEFSDEMVKFPT